MCLKIVESERMALFEPKFKTKYNFFRLISRMLLRNPDKRATLMEIANHPWLSTGKQDSPDMLPLVSREHLSEEDHNLIVQKIVNGNIASKDEIQE